MAHADLQAHPGRPSWLAPFGLLCADFRKVFEYVEPVDANLHVYSHRLYELYLRACTEFESVCREALSAAGVAIAGAEPNVNDYRNLEPFLGMERFDVTFTPWHPVPAVMVPFPNWSTATPALAWYRDYNLVKHGRHQNFPLASLKNVRLSLAGLFAILAQLNVLPTNQRGMRVENTRTHKEISFYEYPGFVLRISR
jgi:hypothetical protein